MSLAKVGQENVHGIFDDINAAIDVAIQGSQKGWGKVSTSSVAKRLDKVREFFKNTTTPERYLSDLKNLSEEFKRAQGTENDAAKAQALKKNTKTLLRKAYGELKSTELEGQKAVARGLREEIVKLVPEVGELNAREAKLIGLEEALERFVGRQGITT